MSDQVNHLLTKALSTESMDEAISCLRMARKKNKDKGTVKTNAGGKDWKSLAEKYYRIAKDRDTGMNEYYSAAVYYRSLYLGALRENDRLRSELKKKRYQISGEWIMAIVLPFLSIILIILLN
jgi:hypothetical protein